MTQQKPNRELVVYALHLLGGDTKQVHTEDIALKCHELFPSSFSWTKYPEHPDKDIVRLALRDARKTIYGALVDGRSGLGKGRLTKTQREPASDGWMLTEKGLAWLKERGGEVEALIGSGQVREHRRQLLRQLKRIEQHNLFERFREDGSRFGPSIGELADLLRCRVDAEPHVWQKRLDSLRRKAQVAEQADLLSFVELCEQAYVRQR